MGGGSRTCRSNVYFSVTLVLSEVCAFAVNSHVGPVSASSFLRMLGYDFQRSRVRLTGRPVSSCRGPLISGCHGIALRAGGSRETAIRVGAYAAAAGRPALLHYRIHYRWGRPGIVHPARPAINLRSGGFSRRLSTQTEPSHAPRKLNFRQLMRRRVCAAVRSDRFRAHRFPEPSLDAGSRNS